MNNITLMGRLTRDPELRQTQTGTAVASFTLAVDRPHQKDKKQEADFIDCVAWQSTAEFVSKFFTKGMKAAVTGRLQLRDWVTKDGDKRRTAEIIVDHVYFCESKKKDDGNQAPGADFAEITEDDGDLPF